MTWEEYKAQRRGQNTQSNKSSSTSSSSTWEKYKQDRIEEEERKRLQEEKRQQEEREKQEKLAKQQAETEKLKQQQTLPKATYGPNTSTTLPTAQDINASKYQPKVDFEKNKVAIDGIQSGDIKVESAFAHDTKQNIKKTAGTIPDIALNTAQGFVGVAENSAPVFAEIIAEAAEKTGHKEYAERVRRNIADPNLKVFNNTLQKGKDAIGNNSWAGDTVDQMFQGIGQTAGYAALGALPGGTALNTGAMFTSAAGGELSNLYGSEDYKNGDLRKGKIWAKAIGSGAIEAAAERALGYFGSSGGIDKRAANYLSNLASTSMGKVFARQGVNAAAEGFEEVLSYAGNYLLDSIIDYVDKQTGGTGKALRQPWNWQELWQQAFTAAGSALIMGGFDTAITAKFVNGTSASDALNKTAQKMDLNAQLEKIQSQNEKLGKNLGKNISQQEANNIFNQLYNNQQQAANIQTQLEELPTAKKQESLPVVTEENLYSNKLKQTATEEINNSNVSQTEKKMMLDVLNKMDNVTDADLQAIRQTIHESGKSQGLESNIDYKNDQERRQKYMQYKNDTSSYDSTAVDEVLETIPQNRNGRRTVKQWLQAADEIGKRIANLSNEEIEKIAYKSWFDIQPSKSITQYDRQAKQQVGFQKFTSDEWINTINKAVNEARANNEVQQTVQQETQALPVVDQKNAINKSDSQVKQEVSDYLKKNNIKMSVDEFMEWASNKQLEQENNMTSQQQELYSLISDIQNRRNDLMVGEKSKTSDKNNLNIAIQMKQNQATNEEIFKKTGWIFGDEGKWKSELNDKNFKVKNNLKKDGQYWLERVFDAKELYQAYPDLKFMAVDFMDLGEDISGGYNFIEDNIVFDNKLLEQDIDIQKKNILHEIQHAIQAREGFAEGASTDIWAKRKTELKNSIESVNKEIQEIHDKIGFNRFSEDLRNRIADGEDIDYWKEIENFENDSSFAKELKELNKRKDKYIEEYLKVKNRDNFELYLSTAGEQEAAMVEERSDYTDEQRKNIVPIAKNDKTVYIKSNFSMKEGAFKNDMDTSRNKKYSMESSRDESSGNGRLSSKDSNQQKRENLLRDSETETTENKSRSGRNIESNSRKEQIENSNESSFNLPKDVKEIANLNKFIRDAIKTETDSYWLSQLKEASAANYVDWTRKESRLHWKRDLIQQYLDYKNSNMSESRKIQGLEDYDIEDLKAGFKGDIQQILEDNDIYDVDIIDLDLHGSRLRGTAKNNSDLDVVVQYEGDIREDDLFDILNEKPLRIEGIKVDINPIQENIKDYMERSNKYDQEILSKNNAQDSQGRKLNKKQQEFFKDSKARNENGNLLEVYQGTPTGGFTIYDTSKLGKTTGAKDATLGIHFTDNLDMANTFKDYVTDEIYEQAKKEIYKKYDIKENEIIPFDMQNKINKEIDSLAKSKVKETAEVKRQYLNIKKPMSIFADYGINEEQLANDLVYALTGSYDITDTTDYFENNQDFLLGMQQNFNNELAEMKDELAKPECVNRLKELGYDGVILPLQSTDKVGLAQLGMNTKGNEYIVFNSNQAKNIDNKNPTLNPDIRYELEDTSNNTAENEVQRKINRSMTMKEAQDMVQRAFVTGNIYDWFDGEYKNGDEWLAGEGAEQVALIIDNDYQLQQKFVNNNQDILNEEYMIEDVIEAYENGTLTGNNDKKTTRLDTSKETGYKDERFYAPKDIQGGKDLYNIASQRVTNTNRQEVYKARADFILNAHNKGYIESLGLTQKEVNENLRKWANYPKKAMDISNSINEGVAKENRWTGIENSSIVNELSVSKEQLDSLVKEIKGTTNEWQRRYISNTMLAIDTHIDYKGLTYDFAPDVSSMSKNALADYFSEDDTIRVRREGQNTIAHETGHFIDHLLGRKIGDGYNLGITSLCRSNLEWTEANTDKKFTAAQKQFLNNFNNFLTSIEDVSDIGSSYKMSSNEVFARFVARFTEWTRNVATGNRYGYESKWYDDHFTQSQYREFAKLLQEYSLLETTGQVSDKIDRSQAKKYDQKIDDIYSELFNTAPTADNVLATSEYTKKQSKVKEQEQIAKILEEPVKNQNEKNRTWAILKANIIDKGKVFEELSHKTKNRELQGKWDYMLTAGARGQNAIGNTRYDMDSNNKTKTQISKSLEDIRAEVGKNTSEFQNYMYHQLNIDRMTLEERFGIDNKPVFSKDVSADYSKQKVEQFEKTHPEFKGYAQDIYDFLDANKKELVDRGVIPQELSDKLKEMYPHYVPIKRVDAKGAAIKVPLDTMRTGVNSPLARATGGSSDIQPMFQTIADRTLQTYRASARNSFGVELMNALNSTTESVQTDVDSIIEQIGDENTELLKEGKNGQNPTFTVFNNGEKVTFEITKDMYDALKPQSDIIKNINNSLPAKVGRSISNFRRGVLTEYNPIFSLTNAMKDAQDVVVNSQHPAKTFAKFGESYAQILQKGYWYNEYIQNGGEQNSYFRDGEFASDKRQSKLKTAIKVPFKAISNVNNVIEMAPRLAEYIASREAGRSIETSMLDAARVTTNFKAGGDWTKTLNRNGATFLNASVQGFQQQIRNIQEANTKGLKGYAVLATKYAVAGLPALLLNGLIWKDDDDYNDLQDYAKDNYYIIAKYGDGKFIRIPKGRVAATAQKIVSNITEYMTDDKKSFNIDNLAKDFWEDLKFAQDNIAPNNPFTNNVLSPIIDVAKNKTWYGSDLVPTRLQNKPKKEQYDETTDSLSIWLGDKLNVSPYKINYLLDQYGGGAADVILPKFTKQAENNVFTDKFTTDSVMKSKYPGNFYSELDDLKVKANSIEAKDEDIVKYKYNSSISGQMSKLYTEKREIQNSDLTDKEKKEQLKEVQKKINSLAKEALEGTDTAKISGNTATISDKEYYKTTSNNESTWNKVSDKEKEKNENISLKTYADYKNKVIGKTKDSEKIQVIVDSSYSNQEKLALYENYVNSNDKNISLVKDLNINTDEYLKYKANAGTKKADKVSYMENSMKNVSYMNKLILLGTEYVLTSSEKSKVYTYVSNLDISKKQKMEILSRIKGFTVSESGSVKY